MEGSKDVALVFGRELRAVVEAEIQRSQVALHEHVGHEDPAGKLRVFALVANPANFPGKIKASHRTRPVLRGM